ncbi:MAG: hypothetical protein ACOYEW_01595 [Anaerolineae bacterium]
MSSEEEAKRSLNSRLETIGWGLFLIMLGGLGLVPNALVPEGAWLLGVGVILLGLNAARYRYGIKTSGFTIVLGIIALGSGLSSLLGVNLPWFPLLLIIGGAVLLFRTLVPGRADQR